MRRATVNTVDLWLCPLTTAGAWYSPVALSGLVQACGIVVACGWTESLLIRRGSGTPVAGAGLGRYRCAIDAVGVHMKNGGFKEGDEEVSG